MLHMFKGLIKNKNILLLIERNKQQHKKESTQFLLQLRYVFEKNRGIEISAAAALSSPCLRAK